MKVKGNPKQVKAGKGRKHRAKEVRIYEDIGVWVFVLGSAPRY